MRWHVGPAGFIFDGRAQGVAFPLSTMALPLHRALADRSGWQALEHLWGDGLLETTDGVWTLRFADVYKVSSDLVSALELPSPTVTTTAVRTVGTPGHPGLRINVDVTHPGLGTLEGAMERVGPVYLPRPATAILVEPAVFELLRLMETGASEQSLEGHLEFLASVKAAAARASAGLDPFLSSQDLIFPQGVSLHAVEETPDRVSLSAKLTLPDGTELDADRGPSVRRVVSVPTGTTARRRVVMMAPIRDRIRELNGRSAIEGADVPRFLENPEAFVPPGLDLSEFSKRVVGFKTVLYNSRPYLHINPSSGGWFEGVPGLELQDARGIDQGQAPRRLDQSEMRRLVSDARQTGDEWVRHDGGWVKVDPRAVEQLDEALAGSEMTPQGTFRLSGRAVLEIYENIEALEFDLPPSEQLGIYRRISDYPSPPLPSGLRASLLPHQHIGFRWLALLHQKGTGGLLADDMGLGKTVQVISHFARLAEQGELKPSLVVCPGTVIENWLREFAKFAPGVSVSPYSGQAVTPEQLANRDVVITSYDTLRARQLQLARVDWRSVVCDEAQYAKNPTAQRTAAVKALKAHHRMALTGTPVENGMVEFWCIMDFVRPGHLGSWSDFRDIYERPLVEAVDEEARRPIVDKLIAHLRPHYLRRMKEEVLSELPPKAASVIDVGFGERQFEIYRQVAATGRSGGRGQALAAITTLLQVCAHPRATDSSFADRGSYTRGECPKLDAVLDTLASIRAGGEKVLIFTRFIGIQRMLQQAIFDRFHVWPDLINGQITGNRQRVVDVFQARPGFGVLILSHDVGGVGLNITEANHVIHYTRPWNPAKENQATDRAHRIGQQRAVTVHYPILSDDRFVTVEKRLATLLDSKRELARDVLRASKDMEVNPADLMECLDVPDINRAPAGM